MPLSRRLSVKAACRFGLFLGVCSATQWPDSAEPSTPPLRDPGRACSAYRGQVCSALDFTPLWNVLVNGDLGEYGRLASHGNRLQTSELFLAHNQRRDLCRTKTVSVKVNEAHQTALSIIFVEALALTERQTATLPRMSPQRSFCKSATSRISVSRSWLFHAFLHIPYTISPSAPLP